VKEIMVEDPISVSPELRTVKAVEMMREHQIGALPVVREERLVGIITERDFIQIAGNLLDDSLAGEDRELEDAS
jgi:CBS domain-containing protein